MELRRNARFRPAVHKLKIDPNVQPVKQAPRRMRIELEEKVVIETKKLIEAGFIQEEENPDWIGWPGQHCSSEEERTNTHLCGFSRFK